jgi:hypothetical protein
MSDFDWMKERDGILGRTDDEIERLRSTVTELVAALEPFAKEADRLRVNKGGEYEVLRPTITAGELRRARAAIQKARK